MDNLINVIITGGAKIDNIAIKGDKLIGSNGHIDRLPKIENKQLLGRSPIIIISQIGSIGYKVTDFKGTITNMKTRDIIQYAKNQGIANGKIVNKEGKEFISAISGNYVIEEIKENLFNRPSNKEKTYIGELIQEIKPLPPIVIRSVDSYEVFRPMNKDISREFVIALKHKINKQDIYKDIMYRTKKYTLSRKLHRELDITDERDRADLISLIKIKENEAIMKEQTPKDLSVSPRITLNENIDISKNNYCTVNQETMDSYIELIRKFNVSIVTEMEISYKDIVLVRICEDKSVDYRVLHYNEDYHYDEIITINIEQIYTNSSKYENVTLSDKEMQIVALDGAYKYDMAIMSKTYQGNTAGTQEND